MELVKNKASGKIFIVLEDDGDASFLLITPEGKVKPLERRLFSAMFAADDKKSKWHDCLTSAQMEKYSQYVETPGTFMVGTNQALQ